MSARKLSKRASVTAVPGPSRSATACATSPIGPVGPFGAEAGSASQAATSRAKARAIAGRIATHIEPRREGRLPFMRQLMRHRCGRPPRDRREAERPRRSSDMAQKRGKRYEELSKKIDRSREYTPEEGVKLVKDTSAAKFDTTVEIHLRMGVDPKQADQMVRGSAVLPNGTGKTVRVIVFAQGARAQEAQTAGADAVGADDLAKRIEGGWLDFDVAIATPDMMGAVGRLGKVLGPRGLMPNPKSGTVTFDVTKAVRDSKGGRIEFRVDKTGVVHTVVGKSSFSEQALLQNLATLMDAVNRARPAGLKANYIDSIYLTSTQGPSVKLDLGEATALAGKATG